MSKKSPNFGINAFGIILIVSSISNLLTIVLKQDWYLNELYAHWPAWAAWLRYGFSFFQRILGLTAGFGLLFRKEFGRIIALVIGCFTISTVYWKHPFVSYFLHTHRVMEELTQAGLLNTKVSLGTMTMIAMITNCLLDIGFCLFLIYFLTRPAVVSIFKRKDS